MQLTRPSRESVLVPASSSEGDKSPLADPAERGFERPFRLKGKQHRRRRHCVGKHGRWELGDEWVAGTWFILPHQLSLKSHDCGQQNTALTTRYI